MNKKIIGVILIASLLGIGLTGCNVKFGVQTIDEQNRSQNVSKNLSVKDISNIDIYIAYGEVEVKEIDGDNFTINISGTTNIISDTRIESNSGEIKVKDVGNGRWMNRGFNSLERRVTIGVPKGYKGDFEFNIDAGRAKISGLSLSNFTMENAAGDVAINDIEFNKMKYRQDAGKTEINLNKKSGEIDAASAVGDFSIKLAEVGGNLKYEGDVGKATISIPENSPVVINSKADLGNIDVRAKTSGENKYIFDLQISLGQIVVE